MQTDRRREQWGWYLYDWANSAFASTVVTLFFGPYLTELAKAAAVDGFVTILGLRVAALSVWPYLVSLSVLTQVIALPLLGAIADYGRRKKEMLGFLAYLGAFSTIAMFWLQDGMFQLGCLLFLVANLAFGGSIVIYNSFLPEISTPEERDSVSSKGWGLGYLGGGILLALNLLLFAKADSIGLSQTMAVRISLASAGIWWAAFTLVPMATLKNRSPRKARPAGESIVGAGFRQLFHTLGKIRKYPQTLLFLVAFLIYNDAIQTVITMSAQFGQEELKLPMSVLTSAVLMVQFVAFAGALLFDRIARLIGNKQAVMLALAIWSGTLIYIYAGVSSVFEFYLMAGIVGTVMGGSQALSRSIYSMMIPHEQEAEYFSIYEISDKGTSWLGPLFFGLALQWTGNYRLAVLSLIVFFIAGLLLLTRVDVAEAAREAGNEPPRR